MKASTIRSTAYWTSTAILVFALASGGIGELTHSWGTLDTVSVLGYPAYLLTILGFWKILGAAMLLSPRLPRLKEWAYAGIFFNMTGAAASHALANDFGPYAYHLVATLGLACLALGSRALQGSSATTTERPARVATALTGQATAAAP